MSEKAYEQGLSGGRQFAVLLFCAFSILFSLYLALQYFGFLWPWVGGETIGAAIHPASLIGVMLAGIGVIASLRRPGGLTFACGLFTAAIGTSILLEYAFYADFGIDSLLNAYTVAGVFPYLSRMPAMSALNLALIGIGLCFLAARTRDRYFSNFMARLVIVLASVQILFSVVTNVFDMHSVEGWQAMPCLGPQGVLVFGSLFVALALRTADLPMGEVTRRQQVVPLLAGIVISLGSAALWLAFLINEIHAVRDNTRNHAQSLTEQIQTALEERLVGLQRAITEAGVDDQGIGPDKLPMLSGSEVQMKGVTDVAFIDPAYRVRHGYPDVQFQNALTGWILSEDNRALVDTTRNLKRPNLVPVPDMTRSRPGFLVLVPVFSGKGFEGTIALLVDVNSFFAKLSVSNGYFDQITLLDGRQIYTNTRHPHTRTDIWEVSVPVNFLDLHMLVTSSPGPATVRKQGTPLPVLTLMAGYAIAILIGSILYLSYATHAAEKRAWNALTWQKAITDGSDFIIFSTDEAGILQSLNPAAERLLGYKSSEVCGRQTPMLWHDPSEVQAVAQTLGEELGRRVEPGFETFVGRVGDGGVDRREWTVIAKEGRRISVLVSVHAIRDERGKVTGYVGIVQDLTHERDQEKRIADQQAKIISSSRLASLGEMAGGIAHEINNPLSIISCRAQQVTSLVNMGQLDESRITKYMLSIEETVLRIAKIIKGLRSFARESAGDPFVMVDINSVIADTLSFCAARFEHHDVALRLVGLEIKQVVECRPFQISQVLLNLLNNAFDAVQNEREKWVELALLGEKNGVRITVTDSGSGIPEQVREKMMEPFFTTKPVGKGTGLGLSISRGIAADHGGFLEYDASSQQTRFVLWLPRVQDNGEEDAWTPRAAKAGNVS